MRRKIIGLAGSLGAVLLASAVTPAAAQVADGVYIGAGAGLNYHEDADIEGVRLNGDAEFDMGFALSGSVGYSFGGPRVELELSYRLNSGDKANVAGANINNNPNGDISTTALLFNFFYDIGLDSFVTPYVGAGVGGGYADHDDIGDELVFAYQGIVGASFYISENLDAFVDYRYFGTTQIAGGEIGRAADIDNRNHTLMVGLRYSIGTIGAFSSDNAAATVAAAPPPPPPPPPVIRPSAPPPLTAAAPAERPPAERNFLVFFDFDSAQVRPEGAEVIRQAADASRVLAVTRIDVTGHADRAGGAAYNDRLSRRRALAVKERLLQDGVPEKDIIIYARGEREPLVPTRDGVREPQNRRVEIVLN